MVCETFLLLKNLIKSYSNISVPETRGREELGSFLPKQHREGKPSTVETHDSSLIYCFHHNRDSPECNTISDSKRTPIDGPIRTGGV